MLRFDRELAAIRRGTLREAIRLLHASDTTRFSREERRVHRVYLAEVQLLRGDVEQALRAVAGVATDDADPSLQSRALVVRGVITADSGDVAGAVAVFRRALEAARKTGQIADEAYVETRMIAALAERWDAAQLTNQALETRQHVVRSGDPHLTVHFNLTQARVLARANAIDQAWHYLDLAGALLPVEPSHVLEAQHAFTATLLSSSVCRHTDAVQHGRRALHEARTASYGRLVPRILANLALALVHLGHVGEAETLLDEALLSTSISAEARVAMLDTKAQICLLRHDVAGCRALLSAIEDVSPSRATGLTWVGLQRQETATRVLLLSGDYDGAAATAADARSTAQVRGDRRLAPLFGALEADARIHLGDLDTARELIDASAACDPSLPLANVVEIERVRASLARASGDAATSELHADRVRRLVCAAGTAQQRDTLIRDRWEVESPGTSPPNAIGTAIGRNLLEGLETFGHLFACAGHPALLAGEVAALLDRVVGIEAVRLVVYDQEDRLLSERMLKGPRPRDERPAQAWPMGNDREGRHELHVWVGGSTSRAGLAALAPIAEAVVALVASRQRGPLSAAHWADGSAASTLAGVFGTTMRQHVEDVVRAASSPFPVLITGETGTGKELAARELHRLSRLATCPFVPFNCAAVPRDMLESQLFGHRRGAFTGANTDFHGVVGEAAGGSLFLDEIGELDVALQPKLLRFLETGELQRLGEARPLSVNVRTIAATNANIEEMLSSGRFREDLFYRLNTVRLHLPPLRERREDVPALARHFLDRSAKSAGKLPLRLSSSAVELLTIYDWPGNVRELMNEMSRLTVYGESDELITPERLSKPIRSRAIAAARRQDDVISIRADTPLEAAVSALERELIARAFKTSSGRVTEAAMRLGLSRKGLFLKRKRHGLD